MSDAPPLPGNEAERLSVLRGLGFELLAEARFADRLVRLGATHFDTPHCFIGLIQEQEEMFLASLNALPGPVPRDASLCAYTIAQEDVFIVKDVLEDDRFKDNPTIQQYNIQWYAGAPISVENQNIGTFCLMARENRSFPRDRQDQLKLFAEEASEQIQLRNKTYDNNAQKLREEVRYKLDRIKVSHQE